MSFDLRLHAAFAERGLPAPRHLAEVGSTNDESAVLGRRGAVHGTCVLADRQTAGRGRLGRRWEAESESALLLSVVLRTGLGARRVPLLCPAAAVAVAEAAGPALRIKWPNDVLLPDGRKVAGILAEVDERAPFGPQVVVGVGVNLTSAPALPEAGCLAELGAPPDRASLAAVVVEGLLGLAALLEQDPAAVLHRWRARSATLGARVRVGEVEGLAVDIAPDGALRIVDDNGREHRITAGDVSMVARRPG